MKQLQRISILADGKDVTRCPVCGMSVKIVRRADGYADHYEAIMDGREVDEHLARVDPETAAELHKRRQGKKTVAIVGMAATSCALAPFDDKDVEIWACNEMHAFSWLERADRWFQIHGSGSYKRKVAKGGVHGHYDWLKRNPWNIPIYLQYYDPEIPNSRSYPLREIMHVLLGGFERGLSGKSFKYFTSSFAYMIAVALLEGRDPAKPDERPFDRIEIYGFEMADDIEYVRQKACAEFWVGIALGKGIEVYTPEGNQLLHSTLYGGTGQGAGW